jgi:hypothetical protein
MKHYSALIRLTIHALARVQVLFGLGNNFKPIQIYSTTFSFPVVTNIVQINAELLQIARKSKDGGGQRHILPGCTNYEVGHQ